MNRRTTLSAVAHRTRRLEIQLRQARRQLAQTRTELTRTRTELARVRTDAVNDHLTGLPNRHAIWAEQARRGRREPWEGYFLAVLDLDRFKPVNDLYGHGAGDSALCEIATRLAAVAAARQDGFVGRLGGDEFVFLAAASSCQSPSELGSSIVDAVTRPIHLSRDLVVRLGTSIGLVYAQPGDDADRLLAAADVAMYEAKRAGGNTISVYDVLADLPDVEPRQADRLRDQREPSRSPRPGLTRPGRLDARDSMEGVE